MFAVTLYGIETRCFICSDVGSKELEEKHCILKKKAKC